MPPGGAGSGGRHGTGGSGGVLQLEGGAGEAGAPGGQGGASGGEVGAAAGASGASGGGDGKDGPDFDPSPDATEAVAFQMDWAHTGSAPATGLTPPFAQLWSLHFGAGVSYPVMAGSRVFVTVNPGGSATDTTLVSNQGDAPIVMALDAASGTVLWTSDPIEALDEPIYEPAHLAYDRGRVFAMNGDGNVVAFDAATGAVRWQQRLEDAYGFGTMPVAAGGALFLTVATTNLAALFVLDERDGKRIYLGEALGIGHPTLGDGRLFSSGGCQETEGMNAATGDVLWHYEAGCYGGGGALDVFHAGKLWVKDDGTNGIVALDAASGTLDAYLESEDLPEFNVSAVGDTLVLPSLYHTNSLEVFDAMTGALSRTVPLSGPPVLPALVTPDYAFVMCGQQWESKYLYAVDLASREVVWQSSEPAAPNDPSWTATGSEPATAMGTSGGRIVAAYGRYLSAYAATASN
jgi:outer membrane protein assembly factor BamB